jgi:sugar phosphate isomerase/epimerase
MKSPLTDLVQVNIPFRMLSESYLDGFIKNRLNPEIGFDAEVLDGCPISRMEAVAAQLLDAGLTITFHAPFMDLSPGSPDPKVRDLAQNRLDQLLRLMPLFRPKTVVCHTGYDHRRYWHMRDLWLKNSLDMWSRTVGDIQSQGARMMLENVYEQTPEDMVDLLKNLRDQGAGFCLDSGHQTVFGMAPMAEWIDLLGPYMGQLHLHDNDGTQDDHLALGRGCIDFHELFERVVARSPERPVITLEPHEEADLWPSLTYLEKIWPW